MSKLLDLKTKIHTLAEIQSILGAMKNLAVIEMSKVGKLLVAQNQMAQTIEDAVADFETFNGLSPARGTEAGRPNSQVLCLLIGSERGFCGPFNERVIEAFTRATKEMKDIVTVVVGRKLSSKMEGNPKVNLTIDGPNSADEISGVINDLAQKLLPYAGRRWVFIKNVGESSEDENLVSFPLEEKRRPKRVQYTNAPLLNMKPQDLYPDLMEQYLFSVLHKAFYISFMAENRERLRHMEGALSQIEKNRTDLSIKLNGERQEEITEELEVLMLSSVSEI